MLILVNIFHSPEICSCLCINDVLDPAVGNLRESFWIQSVYPEIIAE